MVYGEHSDTGRAGLEITIIHTSPTTIDPSDHEGYGARETPVVTQRGSGRYALEVRVKSDCLAGWRALIFIPIAIKSN